ncbi:TonB-dependent receptor [Pseudoalteromonas 'SMAR']|uniref:TonB-dependent receptor n=1 Tax=Pseudoalteromonas 'SMAR' TaxID=3416908 RepID=UPI003AF2C573
MLVFSIGFVNKMNGNNTLVITKHINTRENLTMVKKNKISNAVQLATAIGAASTVFFSAYSSAEEDSAKSIERIAVTGSRIQRQDLENASPVTIVDSVQIEMAGVDNIADLINQLPAVTGITNTTRAGSPTSSINLRGLPDTSTLVLINGHRASNNADTGDSVDLNVIPPAAIERIEILKDGASSIYGSDAIAGVVNIILKDRYEGLMVDYSYSKPSDEGGERGSFNLLTGISGDKGSMVFGANFYEQKSVYSRDRNRTSVTPIPSSAIPSGRATISGFEAQEDGSIIRTNNPDDVAVVTRANSGAGLSGISSNWTPYNYQQVTSEIPDNQRFSLFASGNYEVSDTLIFSAEFIHSDTQILETWAYAPIFSAFEVGDLTWSKDNRYNIFDQDIKDWRRRMTDSGAPRFFDHNTQFDRLVMEFDGEFGDNWTWSSKVIGSQSRYSQTYVNVVNKEHLKLGVGPESVCAQVEGCVQLNPLAEAGQMPEDQWNYMLTDVQMTGRSRTHSFSFDVSGDLFDLAAGTVAIALGAEYRKESFSKDPDGLISDFQTIGGVNLQATEGDRTSKEIYAEAFVPVIDKVDMTFAVRYSDFNDFGTDINPKVGIEFDPSDALKLRATYSTGFRAPSLQELYQGASESFDFLNDPCAAENAGSTAATAGCSMQSDPALFQFLTITTGNSLQLDAEESESFTAGIVWSPEAIEGLNIRLDYFNITQENAIDNPKQYFIDKNAAGDPLLGDRVIRDANGNISQVDVTYVNLAEREVVGVDLGLDYTFATTVGDWKLGSEISWYDKFNDQAHPEAEVINRTGTYDNSSNAGLIPEYKMSSFINWSYESWNVELRGQWLDEVLDKGNANEPVDSYLRFDLNSVYQYNDHLSFSVGIDNVTDEEPPVVASEPSGIEGATYDITGRAYSFKVKYEF